MHIFVYIYIICEIVLLGFMMPNPTKSYQDTLTLTEMSPGELSKHGKASPSLQHPKSTSHVFGILWVQSKGLSPPYAGPASAPHKARLL